MNLAQLKERIMRNTNGLYNDQTYMKDLINEAIKQLSTESKVQASTTITTAAGTGSYALPADFKEVIAVMEGTIDEPTFIYPKVDIASFEIGYAIFNGYIYFKPTPADVRSINLYYYKFLSELSEETDTPEIDSRYHDILAAYASAMILSLPGMQGVTRATVDRHLAFWEEGRRNFQADMQRKNKVTSVRKVEGW